MPVNLGTRFAPDFAGRPPHMAGRDLAIWTRFRTNLPFTPLALHFDVVCGTPADRGAFPGPYTDDAWAFITSKRIDVVAETLDRWILLEIRRGASLSAVGTLQGYLLCWRAAPPDARPAEGYLVTDRLDPDAAALAAAQGILTFEAPP